MEGRRGLVGVTTLRRNLEEPPDWVHCLPLSLTSEVHYVQRLRFVRGIKLRTYVEEGEKFPFSLKAMEAFIFLCGVS